MMVTVSPSLLPPHTKNPYPALFQKKGIHLTYSKEINA